MGQRWLAVEGMPPCQPAQGEGQALTLHTHAWQSLQRNFTLVQHTYLIRSLCRVTQLSGVTASFGSTSVTVACSSFSPAQNGSSAVLRMHGL